MVNASDHVLVDTDQFLWNNQAGLGFFETSNVVVQNSVANHNGGSAGRRIRARILLTV